MLGRVATSVFALLLIVTASAMAVENPKEATGYFGDVTGTVKSAAEDGSSFIITVTDTKEDEAHSQADAAGMIGKDLCIGTRLPRDKAGTPHPHPDDVAFVKTLKPGMGVTVNLFAPKAYPNWPRITKPGKATTQPATMP